MKFIDFVKGKITYHVNKYYPIYFYQKSYSQEGEDILLSRIFRNQKKGFYVDIGAHHPTRFSNTYYFYKLGWRGINIDAIPQASDYQDPIEKYNKYRITHIIPDIFLVKVGDKWLYSRETIHNINRLFNKISRFKVHQIHKFC